LGPLKPRSRRYERPEAAKAGSGVGASEVP